MTRYQTVVAAIIFLVLAAASVWWLRRDGELKLRPNPVPSVERLTATTLAPVGQSNAQRTVLSAEDRISEQEHMRTRVSLPRPANVAWRSGLLDSQSALEAGNKSMAAEVLPEWIRKALQAGRSDLAAAYLWTLMRLAEDAVTTVSVTATLAIYRLGDSEDFAFKAMKQWVEGAQAAWHSEGGYGWSVSMDVRAWALKELSFYGDRRLDDTIQSVWLAGLSREAELLPKVDYAYYLETHGRPVSMDYWRSRLEMWQGARNTFAVLQAAAPAGLTDQLSAFFSAHAASQPDGHYAERVALTASWLATQTGRPEYLDYLLKAAGTQMAEDRYDRNFSLVLQRLAATQTPEALELVRRLLAHENRGLQNTAAEALGFAGPAALGLLVQDATRRAQTGQGFPGAAMKAMLELRTPESDAAYLRIKTDLLSGGSGWQASVRDFDALEFFRKNRPKQPAR